MCDDRQPNFGHLPYSRRQFAQLIGAAGAVGLGANAFAQGAVAEKDVVVKTPDGMCDAVLFTPSGAAARPGVLLWPDAGGLRPVKRDMGRRLAAQGYAVLVVNPYYRGGTAASLVNSTDPAVQQGIAARRTAARTAMTDEAVDRDAKAFIGWLDALPQTSNAKMGVQGYCMGGPLSFRTAAANPTRIGAVATFHGGGLATQNPNSPHLLVEKTSARYLVCVARNDDANDPKAKETLRETFTRTARTANVEVYAGNHGWCVPDNGQYVQAEAERAWAALGDHYKAALV